MIGLMTLYKILSLGFAYPDEENWNIIENMLARNEDLFEGDLSSRVEHFKGYFIENRDRIDDIKSEYLAIFDVGRAIAPYETEYMREKVSRKAFELADIAGFYSAFGFSVNEEVKNKEALDHIAVELEFMALLEWKEQYGKEKGLMENVGIVRDAKMKFLKEHLAEWGFLYCSQIYGLEGAGFYFRLAKILECVLALQCERYHIDTSLLDLERSREPHTGVRSDELTC
jgi:nitrate reductase assembly molybdenum cofactor insertion protein NarJ